jgi:hypothetical protein
MTSNGGFYGDLNEAEVDLNETKMDKKKRSRETRYDKQNKPNKMK